MRIALFLTKGATMKAISIYVHIPFCVKKCAYCDFVSYKLSDYENTLGIERYMNALYQEIELNRSVLEDAIISTIYIGGGTPSSIPGHHIHTLINTLKGISRFSDHIEITIEVNPGTLDDSKINHYLSSGINRVSMGLQTTNDQLLTNIGRIHNTNDFISSYEALRRAGFRNISLDLMFGLPSQTLQDIHLAIDLIKSLKPEHVSAYSLKIEEGTPLYEKHQKGQISLPDEAVEREMYHTIIEQLAELDIHQYELSNFSKTGYESKHNLVYWENRPYLGLGVSAHSKVNQTRRSNLNQINAYIEQLEMIKLPIDESVVIDEKEDLFETIMLGLRLNQGIDIATLERRYEIHFEQKYASQIKKLKENGLIVYSEGRLCLTTLGKDLANMVFVEFLDV